jgi:RHS repeat-associated protein
VDILGIANYQAAVTVNGLTNDYRRGDFFEKTLTAANSNAPAWLTATSTATITNSSSSVTGSLFVPQSPENYTYDNDGNLTSDGRFSYTWDAENRLINLTSLSTGPAASKVKVDFVYDAFGRRIQKNVSAWDSSTSSYQLSTQTKFVYDGWNVIAVLDGANTLLQSFVWGADLSGTVRGAGGVGGLVSFTIYTGAAAGVYLPAYDGNGNVMALVNAASGATVAEYEYDAFGNLVQATGPVATANNILFSSKYFDWETGLYYYGYRYYNPSTGRWLSRDPIGESGGADLYGFVGNDPIDESDLLGLYNPMTGPGGVIVSDGSGLPNVAIISPSWPGMPRILPPIVLTWPIDLPPVNGEHQQPGFVVSLIPFVGSGKSFQYDVENGRDLHAVVDAGFFATDIFMVRSLAMGGGKCLYKVGAAVFGEGGKEAAEKLAAEEAARAIAKKTSQIDRAAFKAEREAFWKAEAKNNPGKYSADDLARMEQGHPPIGPDGFPIELHHKDRTPSGGLDPMSRTDHRLGDNYKLNHP